LLSSQPILSSHTECSQTLFLYWYSLLGSHFLCFPWVAAYITQVWLQSHSQVTFRMTSPNVSIEDNTARLWLNFCSVLHIIPLYILTVNAKQEQSQHHMFDYSHLVSVATCIYWDELCLTWSKCISRFFKPAG